MDWKKWIKYTASAFLAVLCLTGQTVNQIQAAKISDSSEVEPDVKGDYWPEELSVVSPSAIVMEMSTGTVLYEKESREMHYPASITKIMTALIALEQANLSDVITFSHESIDNTEGSGIARDYGEKMTMEQCLYAIMLESANECAYAVAEHIGGSVEKFADMMNERAKELGCVNTHFVNPHGLHDAEHYTCCYDMALIAKAAYQNENFRIITSTKTYMIPPTNKHKEETPLQNHNKMIHRYRSGDYIYEYCTGGKTGYTTMSNSTLVEFAEKDGMSLVSVVMNSDPENQWKDSRNLFDHCFDNFQMVNVAENETNYSSGESIDHGSLNTNEPFVLLDEDACIVLPKTVEFSNAKSSIQYHNETSDIVGTITYQYAGKQVGKADIKATGAKIDSFEFGNAGDVEPVKISPSEELTEQGTYRIQVSPITIALAILGLIGMVLLVIFCKYLHDNIYIIRHNWTVKKEHKRRMREMKIIPFRQKKKRF